MERTFTVQGMGDEEGEAIVEKALMSIEGVESAEADSMMDVVVVHYDSDKVSVKDMQEMVDLCGFDLE